MPPAKLLVKPRATLPERPPGTLPARPLVKPRETLPGTQPRRVKPPDLQPRGPWLAPRAPLWAGLTVAHKRQEHPRPSRLRFRAGMLDANKGDARLLLGPYALLLFRLFRHLPEVLLLCFYLSLPGQAIYA